MIVSMHVGIYIICNAICIRRALVWNIYIYIYISIYVMNLVPYAFMCHFRSLEFCATLARLVVALVCYK